MKMPFDRADRNDQAYANLMKSRNFWNKYDKLGLPNEFKTFMVALLQENPASRCTMADLINHPYMTGDTAT